MKLKNFPLLNANDGEGSDLGGAVSSAIDSLGLSEGTEPVTRDESVTGADAERDTSTEQAAEQSAEQSTDADPGEKAAPGAAMRAMLDELAGDTPAANADGKPTEQAAKPEGEQGAATDPANAVDPAKAPDTDPELAEALEGVKSERGRERVRKVFEESKQVRGDLQTFQRMVASTGMDAEQFAQTLEFGRLVNLGDDASLGKALEVLEGQRAAIYKRLGKEAPGVDLLADHADLREAVSNMEVTRERAIELATLRGRQQAEQARVSAQREHEQQATAFKTTVNSAASTMEQYLKTRERELDHPARMQVLTAKFQAPGFMQEFVSTYRPDQWAGAMRMLYDTITVQPTKPATTARPMRASAASMGAPTKAAGVTHADRIASRLEAMGIA